MSWCAARQAVAGVEICSPSGKADRTITTLFYQPSDKFFFLLIVAAALLAAGCSCSGEDALNCDELECEEPAECDDSEGEATCVCPGGYIDVNEDGSECQDIDECAEGLDDCAQNAICTNTEGSYLCACLPTAYTGDGKTCECAAGYVEVLGKCVAEEGTDCAIGYIEVLGECKAEDGTSCGQDTDCVNGHCIAGICCATVCNTPAECQTSQGATCTDGLTCLYPGASDGTSCDDGDACTTDDTCKEGECVGGEPRDCNDDNPCTNDSCDSESGCVGESNSEECDDGDACTTDDTCKEGECASGKPRDCNDDNPCTDDSCDPEEGCAHENNEDECDDGDACTTDDACDDGECEGGDPPDCDDGNICTIDLCNPEQGCVHTDDSAICDDDNPCTDDSCDPEEGCAHENNEDECDDGDACTTGDTCADGECVSGGPTPCDDGKFCTDDSCDPDIGCVYDPKAEDTPCDDGNQCTPELGGSSCKEGRCVGRETIDCNDLNPCTDDGCDPASGCIYTNINADCEDGNACTINDYCVDGECEGGEARVCDDGNICTNDGCDPGEGCTVTPNTEPCDDGNPCTIDDRCKNGECKNTSPRVCDDDNICTDNNCDPTDFDGNPCKFPNNAAPCDDDDACTTTDVCSGGGCVGSGNACGPNATGCTQATPYNICECPAPQYLDVEGQCVPNTNECTLTTPCDPNASCFDPSSTLGDAECTCDFGFTGDGYFTGDGTTPPYKEGATGCTDIDECADDSCGVSDGSGRASSCNQPEPGIYTCTCNAGYMQIDGGGGPTCSCDLNGIFAIRIETTVSWEAVQAEGYTVLEGGTDTTYSWAILNQNYLPDATLQVESVQCGGTVAELCGISNPVYPAQAYTQFTPNQIYPIPPILPTSVSEMSLTSAFADQPFLTPMTASLLGISLTDPFGEWPPSRQNVAGGSEPQVNGAIWVDHDNDTVPAVTSYVVPPGGTGSLSVDPPIVYGAISSDCPRSNPSADRLPYWWFPSVDYQYVKRFHIASRMISQLSGTVRSCDLIDGDVIGPNTGNNQGKFLAQVRVHSCVQCQYWQEDWDCEDMSCSTTGVDGYDSQPQDIQTIDSSTFIIKRIGGSDDCAAVREMTFP